ncbi:GH25 family lysozyme [Fictibacillus gelatini]|uniref:GH25 family lysozyme n=1 Tax=Fictibacillus gelatini TaxID=225985 RepID=UPI00040ABC02|nr:GH25 family lysozyme [Fictibacillus gelatini]
MDNIVDLSHHQKPCEIDYDKFAKCLDLAIIRTQYGSQVVDEHYKTHHNELRKRGVPTHAYAWVRGVSISDMEKEATDFYNRTKEFNPEVWWLDVEEKSMKDMRAGVSAYQRKLRELGAKKVGLYIAHHLYEDFNINISEFDAVWIPRYGDNNGKFHAIKPAFPCDLWQYTSTGRLPGYNGDLDLNKLTGSKSLEWFVGKNISTKPIPSKPANTSSPKPVVKDEKYKVNRIINGYVSAADAKSKKNAKGTVAPGSYFVFNKSEGMINVTDKKGVPGSWINSADNKKAVPKPKDTKKYVTVKSGDTVSGLAKANGSTVAEIKNWNNLKDVNKIYVGQRLRVK